MSLSSTLGCPCLRWLLPAAALLLFASALQGQSIGVPNFSFESPATTFVDTHIDSWQKTPQPPSYVNSSGYTWDELTGLFANTAAGQPDHIYNLDGNQATYLFADPQVGLFQDYNSIDWRDLPPAHAFNVTYDVGKSYSLTVALNGGGGNMQQGASLLLALYYLDASGNQVAVAETSVVNTAALFPTHTTMTDFQVRVPVVKPGDAWAGKHLGISFYSTVTPALEGGYWDIDNVRLSASPGSPFQVSVTKNGSNVNVSWPSAAGYLYQLQTSPDLQAWSPYQTPFSGTGNALAVLYPMTSKPAYFRVQVTSAP